MRNVHSKEDLLYALEITGKLKLTRLTSITVSGQRFLPEKRYCTLAYLKAILSGKKKCFKNE